MASAGGAPENMCSQEEVAGDDGAAQGVLARESGSKQERMERHGAGGSSGRTVGASRGRRQSSSAQRVRRRGEHSDVFRLKTEDTFGLTRWNEG